MSRYLRTLLLLLATFAWGTTARAEDCTDASLIDSLRPIASRGVEHPELLNDGWLVPEGHAWDAPEAARMTTLAPFVIWELPRATHIAAATLEGDHNDVYRLLVSMDGKDWTELWTAPTVKEPGIRERVTRDLDATARFIRLEAAAGDRGYSVAEARVFCKVTDPWPPVSALRASMVAPPDSTQTMWLRSAKVLLGIVALFLLLVVSPRVSPRARRTIGWSLVAAGTFAWTQFGFFQGKGGLLHQWDMFHYYVGSKYFPELGYFELYRCVAKAEREAGREHEMDRALLRSLNDSRIYPGTWAKREEGRCRASFTPERWDAFRRDIASFRPLFDNPPFITVVSDHGFNATPVHAAWLRWWSSTVPPTRGGLVALAQLDSIAYLGALAFIGWGFGVEACAAVALVFGLGFPWGYNWVGGSFGRIVWLMWLSAGLALLRRDRPLLGSAALTVAGLLRLFPMVFVGAMGLSVLVGWIKERRLSESGKRILAGFALTTALGLGLGATAGGPSRYREFVGAMHRHSETPLTNQMGLMTLLSAGPGRFATDLVDNRLTDPYEIWKDAQLIARHERAPLWAFAVLASVALIAWAAHRGRSPWECAGLAGPLLFSLLAMTSYDYSWLIALVPIAVQTRRRLAWLIGYVWFTQALGLYEPDLEVQHIEVSALLLVALIAIAVDVLREPRPLPTEQLAAS